jgi:hypothetical protein
MPRYCICPDEFGTCLSIIRLYENNLNLGMWCKPKVTMHHELNIIILGKTLAQRNLNPYEAIIVEIWFGTYQ